MRQRLYWARLRTRVRNRIHALIDRQGELSMPQCSDLFGRKGLNALNKLCLNEPDATLLREELALLELIQSQIKAQEARIVEFNSKDETTLRLQSIPGMGKILAAVAAVEIDCVERFSSAAKLCAYAGLVPRTHASGGRVYQGPLVKSRNKWLQWAFIEAAWVSDWLLGLLRRAVPAASRPRQERQYRYHQHRPTHVPNQLYTAQRKERFY